VAEAGVGISTQKRSGTGEFGRRDIGPYPETQVGGNAGRGENEMISDPPPWFYDPPTPHKEECECRRCHEFHKQEGMVKENAKSPDYRCCKEEIENEKDSDRA
jgi:hypothetical protein